MSLAATLYTDLVGWLSEVVLGVGLPSLVCGCVCVFVCECIYVISCVCMCLHVCMCF